MRITTVGVLLVLLVLLLTFSCTRISPGHVGIVVNLSGSQRGVEDFPATTGRVWYNPFNTDIYEYPTFVQTAKWTKDPNEGSPANEEITFTNKDNMLISADISLSYSLLPERVPYFYVKFRNADLNIFTHGFLRNTARDCFNENAGKYSIDQIMGDNSPFVTAVRKCTQDEVTPFGVRIEQFGLIGAPRPPQAVIDSINEKARASQIATQKQVELLQSEADAKKHIAEAEGWAQAGLRQAEAQAKANRIVSDSLTPQLIEYKRIEKWNGTIPQVQGTGTLVNLGMK